MTSLLCIAFTFCLLFATGSSAWSYREDGYSYETSINSGNARPGDGWKKHGDNYYYYYKGDKLTGLRHIDDKAYYFNDYTDAVSTTPGNTPKATGSTAAAYGFGKPFKGMLLKRASLFV